jgi:hypothetical protein
MSFSPDAGRLSKIIISENMPCRKFILGNEPRLRYCATGSHRLFGDPVIDTGFVFQCPPDVLVADGHVEQSGAGGGLDGVAQSEGDA